MKNATPVQIDTELSELMYQQAKHLGQTYSLRASLQRYVRGGYAQPAHLLKALIQEEAAVAALAPLIEPYNDEFNRRGGWTRFFMVTNNGGHLHKTMQCSTCRPTTQFGWMPEYSGSDEAGVVDMAGVDACTVCFPTAPVEKKSMLPFRIEERAVAEKLAAEKAAKLAKAAAERVVVGREVYKTIRAAENRVGWEIENAIGSKTIRAVDESHRAHLDRNAADDVAQARLIAEAIAVTVPGYDVEGLLEKKFVAKVKMFRKYDRVIPEGFTLKSL